MTFTLLECLNCLNRFWWGQRNLLIQEIPPSCDVCGKERYAPVRSAAEPE